MFNYFLDNFKEAGYLDKFMKNHLESRRLESCDNTSNFQAIYFENVLMIFVLLFVGVLASLLLLGIECLRWLQDIPELFLWNRNCSICWCAFKIGNLLGIQLWTSQCSYRGQSLMAYTILKGKSVLNEPCTNELVLSA